MRDLVPLTSRLGMLGAIRCLLGSITAIAAWAPPLALGDRRSALLAATAGYALLTALLEVLRRALPALPLGVIAAALLADGIYLVTVVMNAGGPSGPLALLLPVHVIAVTLLASYRTGLKLAMWHSLLLALAHSLLATDPQAAAPSAAVTAQAVATLWLVALATAACGAYNERELRRGRAGSAALAEMADRLQHINGPDEVAGVLVTAVRGYTGYRRAAALLCHDGATTGHAVDGAETTALIHGPPPAGVATRCWDTGRPVLATALDPAEDCALLQLIPDARNVVAIPMFDDGGPVGLLAVERRGRTRRARIPASVVALLGQFAAHAALAHRNALLLEQIRRLAAIDGLTGLANRRVFDDALTRETQRAHRTGHPLTLLILDIDHFKHVNDTHGHQVGDDVLRHLSSVLSGLLRGSDLPARYGGEEFAVLMPDCHAADAVVIAERVRAAIAGSDSPVPVTISIGLATLAVDADDEQGLVTAADAALYQAKKLGRDRVVRAAAA